MLFIWYLCAQQSKHERNPFRKFYVVDLIAYVWMVLSVRLNFWSSHRWIEGLVLIANIQYWNDCKNERKFQQNNQNDWMNSYWKKNADIYLSLQIHKYEMWQGNQQWKATTNTQNVSNYCHFHRLCRAKKIFFFTTMPIKT